MLNLLRRLLDKMQRFLRFCLNFFSKYHRTIFWKRVNFPRLIFHINSLGFHKKGLLCVSFILICSNPFSWHREKKTLAIRVLSLLRYVSVLGTSFAHLNPWPLLWMFIIMKQGYLLLVGCIRTRTAWDIIFLCSWWPSSAATPAHSDPRKIYSLAFTLIFD